RSPWKVLDSLFRRGDPIFAANPSLALTQWCNYNQAILNFQQRYSDRCLLLNIASIINDRLGLIDLVNHKWNLELGSPASLYQSAIFQSDRDTHRQALLAQFFPEALDLYRQLQAHDSGDTQPVAVETAIIKERILQDWSDRQQAINKLQQMESELSQPQRKLLIAEKKLAKLENLIQAMESSKFWQLRNRWLVLKQKLNLAQNDRLYQDRLAAAGTDSSNYSSQVYSGKSISTLKWLKQNFPQKAAIKRLIWSIKSLLPTPPSISLQEPAQSSDPLYQKWLDRHYPHPQKLNKLRSACEKLSYQPLISVIVPIYNPDPEFLRQAIASVQAQVYPHWELCLADDLSKPYVRSILQEYQADSRIKVVLRATNGHISCASNSALELAKGEYIALLDHDDLLAPHALSSVVGLLNRHPQADFIYSDEDKVNAQNIHSDPYFKPDWCPDTFLSRMYTCHLGVYRRTLVEAVGNFRTGFEGSQDYDLVLRVTEKTQEIYHIADILYHWRIHSQSTAAFADAKTYAFDAGQKAIAEAIERRGEPGQVVPKPQFPGVYTVRYQIKEHKLVSIIIPTKDLADTLDTCLKSIFSLTTYPNFEVIVIDNGSTEAETERCLAHWRSQEPERFYDYAYDIPFNYSEINNYAVSKAQGDYLLFLNNDTEIISPDWIEAMVEQTQRESIGAVGGLLLYPDDTIQHAGVILGLFDLAGHGHQNFEASEPGYISQIVSTNNYSAVTAACLMCRRDVFEKVGGFETQLAIAFNDIDFCLKLVKHGYRNIYLPHVVLYHYESKSRGYEDNADKQARFAGEVAYMQSKWQDI
ncbi:MAG: glycosyltransferase family 2 protein, partial [Cyanobacteria bacterium J06600_6]